MENTAEGYFAAKKSAPEEDKIDMRTGTLSPPINSRTPPIPSLAVDYRPEVAAVGKLGTGNTKRERQVLRDISPYAYQNGELLKEDFDEAKGDLKKLRHMKRMSMPVGSSAHYSYITGPELAANADKDWEEH